MNKPNLTFPDKQIVPTKTATFDDSPPTFGHTPGPWKATGESSHGTYFRVRGTRLGGKWKVCDCNYYPACAGEKEEAEANARIIAIAPDLASALEPVAREIIQGTPDVFEDNWNPHAHAEHVTLTIAECRAILRAFQRINQPA